MDLFFQSFQLITISAKTISNEYRSKSGWNCSWPCKNLDTILPSEMKSLMVAKSDIQDCEIVAPQACIFVSIHQIFHGPFIMSKNDFLISTSSITFSNIDIFFRYRNGDVFGRPVMTPCARKEKFQRLMLT